MARPAHGHALVTVHEGTVLDAWYPAPALGSAAGDEQWITGDGLADLTGPVPARGVVIELRHVEIDLDEAPASAEDAYLRLHLLSHRLVRPNTINLDGIFGKLPIVAWTNGGAVDPAWARAHRVELQRAGLQVQVVDRFPRMTDFVVPEGVRIGDASRVRLGAHLAPGTVVMHEGFVNFNAGTLGTSMVEGRVSQGVVVGDGTDIGGGASIMGTLSGGGKERVALGERVLLGANAGVGISIGDDCVVEAGLYVTAGTKVTLVPSGEQVKAVELSGRPGLLFRRNSLSGAVEVVARDGRGIELNAALH